MNGNGMQDQGRREEIRPMKLSSPVKTGIKFAGGMLLFWVGLSVILGILAALVAVLGGGR